MIQDSNSSQVPPGIGKFFGKLPIVAGEDPARYDELMKLVIEEVAPQALREWLLAKDIADAEWELLRLRTMKAGMVNTDIPWAFKYGLIDRKPKDDKKAEDESADIREALAGAMAGNTQAKERFENFLETYKTTLDGVTAWAFKNGIVSQLHADRMTASALGRRNAAYAELDRLRAKKLRQEKASRDDAHEVPQMDAPSMDASTTPPHQNGAHAAPVHGR